MNELRDKVQAALLDNEHTEDAAIEVLNENGIITLSGMVLSKEIAETAESITKEVNGVISVINQLQVKREDDSDLEVPGLSGEDVIVNDSRE